MAKARSLTSRLLPGADHGLSREDAQGAYRRALIQWLTEMMTGAREGAAQAKLDRFKQAGPSSTGPPPADAAEPE